MPLPSYLLHAYYIPWHAVVFWLGFVCDTIGTGAMGKLAGSLIPMVTGMILDSDF